MESEDAEGAALSNQSCEGYDDLAPAAVRFDVFGVELLAARLEDIMRSKEAADPPPGSGGGSGLARDARLRKSFDSS